MSLFDGWCWEFFKLEEEDEEEWDEDEEEWDEEEWDEEEDYDEEDDEEEDDGDEEWEVETKWREGESGATR